MGTALVTGANRGIGLELCRQLKGQGQTVLAACRTSSPELDALGVEVLDNVDVSSTESVQGLADRVGERSIDLLINNAGILRRTTLDSLDEEGIRAQFEVNSIGPLRVTSAVRARLSSNATVAMVTSRMGSVTDNTSGSHYGYRMSKAALNIASVSLAQDLAPAGVKVVILHPGYVKTGMTGNTGHVSAAESAAGLLARIDETTLENSGRFVHMNGEPLPW
ncbi:MAG: NAD(P)-dependent dehydrogenase (short-subunit alcohol dehydrogenase family) [Myxococcota bacterium]|jgi:NAD(P)-dependent dehydrogenase (short-subunit alcohol dehydrogenase family)